MTTPQMPEKFSPEFCNCRATITRKRPCDFVPPSVKVSKWKAGAGVLLAFLSVQALVAQNRTADDPTAVKLTPFEVKSDKDIGFVAAGSLAGGRISTALKDTPVAYSVVTSEFIEAFNLSDVTEAAQWTVNSSVVAGDNTAVIAFGSTGSSMIRTRGNAVSTPTRNFFPYVYTADTYNQDRIDFARGPNAVLFGAGGVGGTVNSVTKQATLGKTFQSARFLGGSYSRFRVSGDVNQTIGENAAVRVNVVWDQADTWRRNEWRQREGIHLSGVYKITPVLTLRAELERSSSEQLTATTSMRDQVSAWDGRTVFSATPTTALSAAQAAVAGVSRRAMRWVDHPSFGGTFLNYQNRYVTKGAAHSTNSSATNLINGIPILTPGFTLDFQAMTDVFTGVSERDRYAVALAGSPFFSIPKAADTPLWRNRVPTYTEDGQDASVVLNYQLGKKLFFEVAGNVNRASAAGQTGLRRGLMDIYIDIDRSLPSGAPNAHFLHPYSEFMDYLNIRENDMQSFRAQTVYVENTRFGKLQLSAMAGTTRHEARLRAKSVLLPLKSISPDARAWVDTEDYNPYGLYTRLYLDEANRYPGPNLNRVTILNPVNGISETVTPTWMLDTRREDNNRNSLRRYSFFQTAGNLDLFSNRLVLIGAFRRDFSKIADRRVMFPGDMPAGWDGTTLAFRPAAPGDYFGLKFTPKDANGNVTGPEQPADSRPRVNVNGVNLGQPQYAKDRFRSDYDSPALTPNINTFTLGGVVNVTRNLGVYANVSETFSLTAPQQRIDGTLLPPTSSKGYDHGVRFTLPDGRLALSVGRYVSRQTGAPLLNPGNFAALYNSIYDAPVIGDLSPGGRNRRNVARFPQAVYSTQTQESNGYEFEVTANPTRALRIMVNAGFTDAKSRNQGPDVIAFFKNSDAVTRQILGDAGVVIDNNRVASINPAVNDATTINLTRVTAAVNAWNTLQSSVIPTVSAPVPQPTLGSSKWVGNLAADYRFANGVLKGLRVGGGLNYRGGQVVGYRTGDTIRDPRNPAVAIDDPAVGAGTPVLAPSFYKGTATLSYTFRLKNARTLQIDLNVDNVFNRTAPIYGNQGASQGTSATLFVPPPGENISSPARVSVPGIISYIVPINYTLSARINF